MAALLHCLAVSIPVPEGTLAGSLFYQEGGTPSAGVLICPPHPLLAGNMENNVVQAVAAHCAALGLPVLIFDYRAVGNSFRPEPDLPLFEYWHRLDQGGTFTEVIADTAAVLAYCRRYFAGVHLVGYSFGAFIGLAALDGAVRSYTAIAPPLDEHDFSRLRTLAMPGLVVKAAEDLLLATADIGLAAAGECRILSGTDHFFLGREREVALLAGDFISRNLAPRK
ncbi:alpha/beta hydrolase [Thiovibrio sp. JS02]